MGTITWTREMRDGEWLLSEPPPERPCKREQVVVITRELFFAIDDYTRSSPTAPSPGRIYRKALHWSVLFKDYEPTGDPEEDDPNWWLFVCKRDPDDEKFTYHHPYKVELI